MRSALRSSRGGREGSRGEPVTRVCHVGTREGEGLVLRGRVSYLSLIVGFFFFTLFSFTHFFFFRNEPLSKGRGGRDPGKERGRGVSRSL